MALLGVGGGEGSGGNQDFYKSLRAFIKIDNCYY